MLNQYQYDLALKIVSFGVVVPFFLLFFTKEARDFYKDVLSFLRKKYHVLDKQNQDVSEVKEFSKSYSFDIYDDVSRSSSVDWEIAHPLNKNLKVVAVFFDEFEYKNERRPERIQSARLRKNSNQDHTNVGFEFCF